MSNLSGEQRLKHFQLALSMVGITANLMTCELIHSIAAKVDEKGEDFSLRDATGLAEGIQKRYQFMPPPGSMVPPPNLPPEIEKMAREGKIIMGSKPVNPVEDASIIEDKK